MRPAPPAFAIDRSAFLGLTFAMAGVACNTGQSSVVAGVVDIPAQPPQPADAGAPPAAERPEPAPVARAVPGSSAKEPDDEDDDEIGTPTAEGGGVAVARGPCGWVDPATVTRPAGKCSDDQGAAPACTVMRSCQGFAFPRQKCEAYRKYFKPKVAQKALDCLSKLTDKQACDACNAYRCGDLALKSACPDASADATCAQITSKCKSVSMTECKIYLSGLNAAGRAKIASCLTGNAGCGFGIFSCAEGLF
jgi:hypothetical protein